MKLYIDQDEKLTFNKTDTPIEINANLQYFKMTEIDKKEIKTVNGDFSYIDSLYNISNEHYSYLKKNEIKENEISKYDPEFKLDERIYFSEEIENAPNMTNIKIFKNVEMNEDTIRFFNTEEVLEKDHLNYLNETDYQYIISDFLNDIDITNSTFEIMDRFKIILGVGNSTVVNVDIPLSNKFLFRNLNKNISVFINDNKMIFDENLDSFILESNLKSNNIKIEFLNETNENIRLIDPYLLLK